MLIRPSKAAGILGRAGGNLPRHAPQAQNVLNALPKSVHPKAKQALQDIWRAEPKVYAERAFEGFLNTHDVKYPKATACLQKDREELLMFYAFPAAHWPSLQTTNPIESTFGTIRHRTAHTKGCLTRDGMPHMMFKVGPVCGANVEAVTRIQRVAKVVAGIQFTDGMEETTTDSVAA